MEQAGIRGIHVNIRFAIKSECFEVKIGHGFYAVFRVFHLPPANANIDN